MAAQIEQPERFNLLTKKSYVQDGKNLGGKLSLPAEFDTKRLAAGWYKKGQEAQAKTFPETLAGTSYEAPGWQFWRFPANVQTSEGEKKHPNSGQLHEVPLSDGTYVLMFRDADVQKQINELFGLISRERLIAEAEGHTISGDGQLPTGGGMIGNARLNEFAGRERALENGGGNTVVEPTVSGNSGAIIKPQTTKASR